jgi:CHAT domain-containing protein
MLAVSEFNGRHEALPFTAAEVEFLLSLYPASESLLNEAATWPKLLAKAEGAGLAGFSFLHFAGHAFVDGVSGRLSSLAMFDRDVWLDELWECAPFPALVTLSACSGSKSRLYEGDEQIGLATTLLAAGARQVVANLWRVDDKETAALMKRFYTCLRDGNGAGQALALTQRAAVQEGKSAADWAGFRCTGLPD